MSRRAWIPVLLLVAVTVQAQTPASSDDARAAWQFRREVTLPADRDGAFVAIPLPPDVAARSAPGLRDLRLVDGSGREAPFVVLFDEGRVAELRVTGSLVDARQQRRDGSVWTVDFGAVIAFDRLVLNIPATDFTKRMQVELSTDGTAWQPVAQDHWVFHRLWARQPVNGGTLETPGATARYARLTADDTRSRPIDLQGVTAVSNSALMGSRWSQDAALEPLPPVNGHSRYRVAVPAGYPVQRVTIDADDAAFARMVNVLEQRDDRERDLGGRIAYRFRLPESTADVEARDIDITSPVGGSLVVDIADGDTPPLVNPRVRLSGPQTRLITATSAAALTLYYGNTVTRPAAYDLERLRPSLATVASFPEAALSAEAINPRYRAPAPLAFVAPRGAVVDSSAWTHTRGFSITGAEDLYSVTVAAADLAHVRAGLADLRVVDGENRQVPYIVDEDAAVSRVPLTATPVRSPRNVPRTSAWTLALPAGITDAVPFSTLELEVAEGFFTRDVSVLVPDPRGPAGYRVAATTTLRSSRREQTATPVVVAIPLGGLAAASLTLEMADGDNAPLTIRAVTGLAVAPRVTFKAGPGQYRLLFGNADVPAPSYDLGVLRDEVLAYAAVPVSEGAIQPSVANPEHTRALTDMMRAAPPTAVLWSALGVAVVVLLALTRRILGGSSSVPPPPAP